MVLCGAGLAVVMMLGDNGASVSNAGSHLTFEAFRSEFVASVNEAGDIESSVNVEVRCAVKSKGSPGTAILKIIPEGTIVNEGDFVCQLDDSVLKDELTLQRISVAEDKASLLSLIHI